MPIIMNVAGQVRQIRLRCAIPIIEGGLLRRHGALETPRRWPKTLCTIEQEKLMNLDVSH